MICGRNSWGGGSGIGIPISWGSPLSGRDLMNIFISIPRLLELYGSPLGQCRRGGAPQNRRNAASLAGRSATTCLLRICMAIWGCGSSLAARRRFWGCGSIIGARGWAVSVILPVLTDASLGSRSTWWAMGGLSSPRGLRVRRGTVGDCSRTAHRCTRSTVPSTSGILPFPPVDLRTAALAFATWESRVAGQVRRSPAWRRDPSGERK